MEIGYTQLALIVNVNCGVITSPINGNYSYGNQLAYYYLDLLS